MINDFKLNDVQKQAVEDTEGAVLVIAGAGSGKTRVLTARVCHLVEMGVDPYNILAITFTNKAANEMKERISVALGDYAYVWTSTFHSMCARILRAEAERLGYTSNFTIYTDLESERVVKRVSADVAGADPKSKSNYLWHISAAKTAGLSPIEYYDEIRYDVANAKVIYDVFVAYEKELKQSNALDFDDLLLKTVQLFDDFPDVLSKYQERFHYILVDEFQDTNTLQYRIVKHLSGKYGNVFVVGDEDQSIYSWRGAEIKNILDFPKDFKGAKVYKLEQNYRSTTDILDAANNVIKNNTVRNKKNLWSENKADDSIEYYEAYNDRDEADFVTRKINLLYSRGEEYRETAVLVRANSLTRLFEENFNLHGIPYKVFGGFRFFERKEIKDTLAYVRLALNPSDNDSLLRIINYPTRGIGKKSVEELIQTAEENNMTLFSVLINPGFLSESTAKKLSSFTDVAMDIIEKSSVLPPVEFMKFVISRSGIASALMVAKDKDSQNTLENVEELVAAVEGFVEDNKDATISDFMQSVSLVSDTDEMNEDDYVTIATVHAVKGLEFNNVFIVGLEDGIFPVNRAIVEGDIEEERRLMYVAITRARRHLFVINARQRFRFGEMVYNPRSRFITEMQGGKGSVRASQSMYQPATPAQRKAVETSHDSPYVYPYAKHAIEGSAAPAKKSVHTNIDFDAYKKDVIVEHAKFGRGIIISTVGEGEDKTAAIAFKGLGVKRFAVAIAGPNLKIVKE